MIRFKKYSIALDAEYPTVCKVTIVKDGKHAGEEKHTPIYFPRDITGAFKVLHRLTSTDASREAETLADAITNIDENHKELVELVRRECGES